VMSQEETYAFGDWGYPKTANAAFRREAFDEVGGFRDHVRAAEDADIAYRLKAAGWELERREHAAVVHASRTTLPGLVRQQAIWGAGGAWVARQYPGSVPLIARSGLLKWAIRSTAGGLVKALRTRDRDSALLALLRPVEAIAWDLGRLAPNERPIPESSPWRRLGL
jgi:GT2 family glycosyltransferase